MHRSRVVDGRRAAERSLVVVHRTRRADDARGLLERLVVERAEVVLGEVVGEQQAIALQVVRDDALLCGEIVEAVVEPPNDSTEDVVEQTVHLRRLAGVDELAASIEVVAD